MSKVEDCIRCHHPWSSHTEGVFNAACHEPSCCCLFYWDSDDDALAHADEWLAKREQGKDETDGA